MASVALIEIADVFGTLPAMIDRVADRDVALSKLVSAYGVRFAGTGDANGGGRPAGPVRRSIIGLPNGRESRPRLPVPQENASLSVPVLTLPLKQ